jgi:predicted DNA-binding protein (MmcQ/YjbR family)
MKKYRTVEVPESRLEDIIRQAHDLIEGGLAYVDHQKPASGGRLDTLLVDSGHALVIAELKALEDDGMLIQGLDYYDHIVAHLESFARAYSGHKIDADQEPRLLLIAPSFSVTLLNRIKWIDIPVSLFAVKCIQFEDDSDPIPVYTEITAPTAPEKQPTYSLEQQYAYITDSNSRQLAREVVAEIQKWDGQRILVEAIKYAISVKCSNLIVAYLDPRRKNFLISTYDDEGTWGGYRIDGRADWEKVLPLVRARYDRVVAGKKK